MTAGGLRHRQVGAEGTVTSGAQTRLFPTSPPATHDTLRLLANALLIAPDPQFLDQLPEWTRSRLVGCTTGAIREIRIILGELLTNAYRHAEPPYLVRLLASADGDLVRMEVTDSTASASTSWPLGKGLLIVKGLCPRSGVHHHPAGNTVWADLRLMV